MRPRAADPPRDRPGALDRHVREVETARDDRLAAPILQHRGVEVRLRRLQRDPVAAAGRVPRQDGMAGRPRLDDRGIARADMHRRRPGGALQRGGQRVQPVVRGGPGAGLHPGLVQLHHVGAGGEETGDLLVTARAWAMARARGSPSKPSCACCDMVRGPGTVILVTRVPCFLRHSRSATSTACLRRISATTRGTGSGWPGRSSAVPGASISTPQRAGEAAGTAFAPDLAVGDDVEPGLLRQLERGRPGVVPRLCERL